MRPRCRRHDRRVFMLTGSMARNQILCRCACHQVRSRNRRQDRDQSYDFICFLLRRSSRLSGENQYYDQPLNRSRVHTFLN